MILFLQKTWLLWWILAILVMLRWFHLFSSRMHEKILEANESAKEEASTTSKQIPSGTASSSIYLRQNACAGIVKVAAQSAVSQH
jgi:hypothetical protein